MQKIKKFVRFSRNSIKQIFVIVSLLLILDVCAVGFSAYLFGQTGVILLSDLLFIEGAIIFVIGIFLYFFSSIEHGEEENEAHKSYVKIRAFMVVIGVILILASISIGELLL